MFSVNFFCHFTLYSFYYPLVPNFKLKILHTVDYIGTAANTGEMTDESAELLVRAIRNHVTVRLRFSLLLLVLSVYSDEDKQSSVGLIEVWLKFVMY